MGRLHLCNSQLDVFGIKVKVRIFCQNLHNSVKSRKKVQLFGQRQAKMSVSEVKKKIAGENKNI
jgi:hypothetical protein